MCGEVLIHCYFAMEEYVFHIEQNKAEH